jgi:hypothetical protein
MAAFIIIYCWWLVVGGWWLVVGGYWLIVGGWTTVKIINYSALLFLEVYLDPP